MRWDDKFSGDGGLRCDGILKEAIMDLTSLTIAQTHPQTQLRFDLKELELSIQKRDRRVARIRAVLRAASGAVGSLTTGGKTRRWFAEIGPAR